MNKIEQKMVQAIKNRKDFAESNTIVKYDTKHDFVKVYLFDNLIAGVDFESNTIVFCSCGFKTKTTKCRMNAILNEFKSDYYICQIAKQWYYRNYKDSSLKRLIFSGASDSWFQVKF